MSLQYGILGLLSYAPMNGYNLKKMFGHSINYIWTASLSQIYRELTFLERDGLVASKVQEQEDRPDKKVYTITQSGKLAFQAWLKQTPEAFISPKRDEFMLRMFFGVNMGAAHVKEQLALFVKDRERAGEALEKEALKLHELTANFADCTGAKEEGEKYLRFILKRAQLTNRLLVNWAEECLSVLEEPKG